MSKKRHIEKFDNLNQGREKINDSIDASFNAEVKSDNAVNTANQSNQIAGDAKDIAINTDDRLDNMLSGELQDGEVVDARKPFGEEAYPNLGKRLDEEQLKNAEKIEHATVYITPEMFDEKLSDMERIQQAIDKAIINQKTLLLRGEYIINSGLLVDGNVECVGFNNAKLIAADDYTGNMITVEDGALNISGVKLIEKTYSTYSTIELKKGKLNVDGCAFTGPKVNAILLKDKTNKIMITNNIFSDYFYMVCLQGATDVFISGNHFTGGYGVTEHGDSGGNGIKITNDPNLGWLNPLGESPRRIVVTGNIFYKCLSDGIDAYTGATELIISNNVFDDCKVLGVELKTIYREGTGLNGGTSIEGARQGKNVIINGNVFKNFLGELEVIRISNTEERVGMELDISKGIHNVNIANNIFDSVGLGITVGGAKNVNISNNIFDTIRNRAILGTAKNDGVSVIDNVFRSNTYNPSSIIVGFDNADNQNLTFSGNTFVGFFTDGSNTNIGILISGFNLHITNNKIYNTKIAIQINTSRKTIIASNLIEGASESGLLFNKRTTLAMINNNLFNGCGRGINYGLQNGSSGFGVLGNMFNESKVSDVVNIGNVANITTANEITI